MALVEAGAPLEAKDRDARTPLHLACMMAESLSRRRGQDYVAISNYLQYEGAIPSTQDKYGHTPLVPAAACKASRADDAECRWQERRVGG